MNGFVGFPEFVVSVIARDDHSIERGFARLYRVENDFQRFRGGDALECSLRIPKQVQVGELQQADLGHGRACPCGNLRKMNPGRAEEDTINPWHQAK